MTPLDAARAKFLARVEDLAPGQSARFAPPLDALIRWSIEQGMEFDPPPAAQAQVRFRLPGDRRPVWAATARTGDGAKLGVLAGMGFPAALRNEARTELARIDLKPDDPDKPPEMAFTKLIWGPNREAVLGLLGRILAGLTVPA